MNFQGDGEQQKHRPVVRYVDFVCNLMDQIMLGFCFMLGFVCLFVLISTCLLSLCIFLLWCIGGPGVDTTAKLCSGGIQTEQTYGLDP